MSAERLQAEIARHRANQIAHAGVDVEYTPYGGSMVVVKAIPGEAGQAEENYPGVTNRFWLLRSALSVDPKRGDAILFSGVQYEADRVDIDTFGFVTVWARKA